MESTYLWLQGGLGNQLFQLNFGLHVANLRNQELKIIASSYLRDNQRSFEIKPLLARSQKASIYETLMLGQPFGRDGSLKTTVGLSHTTVQSSSVVSGEKNSLLVGFFQDQEAIKLGTSNVCQLLNNVNLSKKSEELRAKVAGRTMLHVRRGDYVSLQSSVDKFGTLDVQYYLRGLENLGAKLSDAIIFSDDPSYVIENFQVEEHQIIGSRQLKSSLETLMVMGSAAKLVIPNSSFSWWASELVHQNLGQVAGPTRWFMDSPKSSSPIRDFWHQIEN